ncbi:Putative RxLR effector, partial [Phytophthora palmivora]
MGLFWIVVVLVTTFLSCSDNSSATTTSKVTDPTFTSNYQLFTESGQSGTHKRMLRTYESPENEDRVNPGTVMGAIKSSSSKLTETAKMNIWLLAKASGEYVLKSLQLGGNLQAVLKNKKLETLFEYVEKFNNGKPQSQQISVVGSLRTHYGDSAVMKALASARQVDETKDVAAKLETELFKGWIQKQDSVDFAFLTLKIHDEGSAVLRIQKIEILENYITFLNAKTSKNENLVDALMLGYGGDRNLLLSLGMAKHDVLVGKKATELETAVLFEKVDRQRRVLQIKDGVTPVLSSEYLNKLERYISKLRATYKNNDVSLTRVLATKYGDERVAKSLVAAKYVEETKD